MSNPTGHFKINLLPLGTCAGNTTIYQKHTAHFLEIEVNRDRVGILLDAGNNRVVKTKICHVDDVEVVLVSHSHLDHSLFIGALVQKMAFKGRTKKLQVLCHARAVKKLRRLIKIWNLGRVPPFVEFIVADLPPILDGKRCMVYEIDAGKIQLKISMTMARHTLDSVAYRIEMGGLLDLVFSPDTSFKSGHLLSFARNAGYWLLDTTFATWEIKKQLEEYKAGERSQKKFPGHSSPEYSAQLCERAGVENYVMIHYFWSRFARHFKDVQRNLIALGKKYFSRRIIVATEMEPIVLYDE